MVHDKHVNCGQYIVPLQSKLFWKSLNRFRTVWNSNRWNSSCSYWPNFWLFMVFFTLCCTTGLSATSCRFPYLPRQSRKPYVSIIRILLKRPQQWNVIKLSFNWIFSTTFSHFIYVLLYFSVVPWRIILSNGFFKILFRKCHNITFLSF